MNRDQAFFFAAIPGLGLGGLARAAGLNVNQLAHGG
jgi:hypothetical protein